MVIDLQDAGVRYWTFQTLTKYFLRASAAFKVEVILLDRPNPINGIAVQGPVSTPGIEDYTTPFPEPMRPGMTLGELARMFDGEERIGARCRAGLHCAPLAHAHLGTVEAGGTCRLSFGPFLNLPDVQFVADALASIALAPCAATP